MLILFQGKNFVSKQYINENNTDSIWCTGKNNEKVLKIENENNKWFIESNRYIKIVDLQNKIDKTTYELQEYGIYAIQNLRNGKKYVLYSLPTYEDQLLHLQVQNVDKLTIGKSLENDICFASAGVAPTHAALYFANGKWMIENYDKNVGVILNGIKIISKQKKLENGDSISILGLKIIIVGNNIFINNPNEKVMYNNQILKLISDTVNIKKIDNENIAPDSEKTIQYYNRMPRVINNFKRDKIKVSPPPAKRITEKMPVILTIGSTLSMGIISIVTCVTSVINIINGTSSLAQNISTILISFVMLISVMLIPIFSMRWQDKKEKEYEEKRQRKYREYIANKTNELLRLKDEERKRLEENYPTTEKCVDIILNMNERLWERKIDDYDFLSINLGTGDEIFEEPENEQENLVMEQDDLQDILEEFKEKKKMINNVPITLSIKEEKVIGLMDNNDSDMEKVLKDILTQIVTFHSYEDVKLVFMLRKDRILDWKHIKMLPYVWDNSETMRFIGTDYINNLEEISNYLAKEFNLRQMNKDRGEINKPYYLIITDNYRNIEKLDIVTSILKTKVNLGFGLFCLGNTIKELPEECTTFIKIDGVDGEIIRSGESSERQKKFKLVEHNEIPFEEIVQTVSNIPLKIELDEDTAFPDGYSFLDMYNVNNIDDLKIKNRWNNNDTITSLAAPIGVNEIGKIIKLDIHEKYHGPHGLIAGSTGSRKIRVYNYIYIIISIKLSSR